MAGTSSRVTTPLRTSCASSGSGGCQHAGCRAERSSGLLPPRTLVRRVFKRKAPNELWLTDITEHPTREGKVYCCAVLDTFSRKIVGWSIDSTQTTSLVLNALGMATQRRPSRDGLVMHSDRGVQFTSWALSQKLRDAGISPSMGAVGSAFDNAMMESFWGRMQVELLGRRRWKTRIELASAIHDYIEVWHNTRRRHSALGMRTLTEIEQAWAAPGGTRPQSPSTRLRRTPGTTAGNTPNLQPNTSTLNNNNQTDRVQQTNSTKVRADQPCPPGRG
jgi:putative transposase